MIERHETLVAKSAEGTMIEFEVNWSDDPEIAKSKVFRMKIGDTVLHVPREELFNVIFATGAPEEQKKAVPLVLRNTKRVERRLTIEFKARKDYREGEIIHVVVPWIDMVPSDQEIAAGHLNGRGPNIRKP